MSGRALFVAMLLGRRGLALATMTPLVLAGCGKTEKDPVPDSGPRTTPKPYTVTYDGKPIELRTVLASTEGQSRVHLLLSSEEHTCEALAKGLPPTKSNDEVLALVDLAPRMTAAGKREWKVIYAFFRNSNSSGAIADVKVSSEKVEQGKPLTAAFELSMKSAKTEDKGKELVLKGDFTANGCGVVDRRKLERRDQKDLKVTVAGEVFVIAGAAIHRRGKSDSKELDLVLSSAGESCSVRSPESDVLLEAKIEGDDKKAKVTELRVTGSVAPSGFAKLGDAKGIAITLADTPLGDGQVGVSFSGATKLGSVEVQLEGKAQALRCAKP